MASILSIFSVNLYLFVIFTSVRPSTAQIAVCNGVLISYNYTGGVPIAPRDPTNQPYRFTSTLRVVNNGYQELKSWQVYVGFRYNEVLVSASNAVLANGTPFPARVGNGTVLAGFPNGDLKTAIETAGDPVQTSVTVQLVGTEFGVSNNNRSLPETLRLVNEGYLCDDFPVQGTGGGPTRVNILNENSSMAVCCIRDLNFRPNETLADDFSRREEGDLIIMYDVINAYDSNYFAQVTISNHNPIARLDNWKLSWEWKRNEFIYSMKGAYPTVIDTTECIFGRPGQYYKEMDFSQAVNCERTPTVIDLPYGMVDDTNLGMVPSCCRNGTILPPQMDSTKAASAFQMQVYKMPPDLNLTTLVPPINWKINGSMGPDYVCQNPILVSPSLHDNPNGLSSQVESVSSWQIVCNITTPKEPPKCCVSFSAFYSDSVIPCNTCACGCNHAETNTCSTTEPPLLLDAPTALFPFENRTSKAVAWAKLRGRVVPNPLPCGDNCGVSINWHVLSDYEKGWTVRLSIFNWGETHYIDWFAAVQLNMARLGFEEVYSFNGSLLNSNEDMIFMKGLPNQNYVLAETKPKKNPPFPGTQQSVILFTKKKTPDINVVAGDGFPTRVLFNGEECALPTILPSNGSKIKTSIVGVAVGCLLSMMLKLFL